MTSNSTDMQSAPYTTKTVTVSANSVDCLTYTIPTTNTAISIVGTISNPFADNREREYKCPYCDTVHDHRTGKCENCGAPLGEAVEI